MADSVSSEMDQLRRENARLIGLLEAHGIAWSSSGPAPTEPAPFADAALAKGPSSSQEKVTPFRSIFRGRDDVYALRWQSSSGRSGYVPACANEWRPGLCEKPRISCRDCNHRELQPLSDAAIYGHLAGEHTVGLYPLLENDHCHLLAVDFDEQDWRDDARAFLRSCRQLAVPAALEIAQRQPPLANFIVAGHCGSAVVCAVPPMAWPTPHQPPSGLGQLPELGRPPGPWPHPAVASAFVHSLCLCLRSAGGWSPTVVRRAGRPAAARRLVVQRTSQLPRRQPEQQQPGQRHHQQRSASVLSLPPSTLHRESRWKGFQRECRKGPDPLRRSEAPVGQA